MQHQPKRRRPSLGTIYSLFPIFHPQTPPRKKRKSSFAKYTPPSSSPRMSTLPSARTRYFDDQRAAAPTPTQRDNYSSIATEPLHSLGSPTPSSLSSSSSRGLSSRGSSSFAFTFRSSLSSGLFSMPSSKGEPTDPELREKIKEEVKAEEKGGGEGKWSAWKAGEMARRYEAQGGDYEDKGDHKNKSQKGAPEKKEGK